jgi:uncharacterized coiled-coil protein SlyX
MSEENTQTVDLSRLEELLVDLNKSLSEANQVENPEIEVITKSADAIIEQNKESVVALQQGVDQVLETLTNLTERLSTLEKSVTDIAETPVAPKAVITEAAIAPADVAVEETVISYNDVLTKALSELQGGVMGDRRVQLMRGISKLDSNFAPAAVAAELNL